MIISSNGFNFIKKFEACCLHAYPDPITKGQPWTIGYGWTQQVDGKNIHPGMVITAEKAEELLAKGLKEYELVLNTKIIVLLTQNQFDACISLTYNIGLSAFLNSTLLKKINANLIKEAADEFLRWNKVNGRSIRGLTLRRKAERELFLS
ncbi:lysozyme [Klebsiella aerogenes]|uniref:lysozyme n=1 Tax=Klebsiella aerogenes TaxID=548 RepID=UPI003D321EC0